MSELSVDEKIYMSSLIDKLFIQKITGIEAYNECVEFLNLLSKIPCKNSKWIELKSTIKMNNKKSDGDSALDTGTGLLPENNKPEEKTIINYSDEGYRVGNYKVYRRKKEVIVEQFFDSENDGHKKEKGTVFFKEEKGNGQLKYVKHGLYIPRIKEINFPGGMLCLGIHPKFQLLGKAS